MSERINRRYRQRTQTILAAAAAAVSWATTAVHAQNTPEVIWDGGSSVDDKYITAENWNPDTVPSNAANQFLQINDGSTALVQTGDVAEGAFLMLGMRPLDTGNLNITGGTITLGEMRVGGRETINSNLADWTLGTFDPNGGGTGTVTQTGGNVSITYSAGVGIEPPVQSLYIGDAGLATGNTANGTYSISGDATLTSGINGDDSIVIGTGVGTVGDFNQSGTSIVTSTGFLTVGRRGATATYDMTSGTLNVQGTGNNRGLLIGDGDPTGIQTSSGTFTQTDGDVNVTGNLEIGRRSGTGIYHMNAGTLDAAALIVGGGPTGTTDPLLLQGNGTFNLNNGTVTITGNGNVGLTNGTVSGGTTLGDLNIAGGSMTYTGNASILAIGNGINTNTATVDVTAGTLSVNGSGAEISIGRNNGKGRLTIDDTGSVVARGIQVGGGAVGGNSSGDGELTVNGGSLTVNGTLTIVSTNGANTRTVNVNDGTVNIATWNNGAANGAGGLNRSANFAGGTTNITNVTGGVSAVWNFTGGTNTLTTVATGTHALWNLSGGLNTFGTVTMSNTAGNSSVFSLTGGTNRINNFATRNSSLYISGGTNTIASGAFPGTLEINSGGDLTTDNTISLDSNIVLGNGQVIVNSGSLTLTGPMNTLVAGGARTMIKDGPGTLTISGSQTHFLGSNYNVNAGVLNMNADGTANLGINANGGTTNFGVAQNLRQITVNNGATLDMAANNATVTGAVTLTNGTINGTGIINAGSYTVEQGAINPNLLGSGALTKNTGGTVNLTGGTLYTGGNTVNGGVLNSTKGFRGGGPMAIASGAKAVVPATSPDTFNPPSTVPAGTNDAGSRVTSLSILGSGQLDLNNNDMVIDHDGSLDIADIRALIGSGYNFGGQDGPGIISTTAALTDPFTFTLGYADNASLPLPYGTVIGTGAPFAGYDVDDTAALIKFTWVGDVTLDGVFDFQDLSIFNGNYDAGATTGRVWTDGDLNYDGTIDFQDLSLFNGNYDPGKPSLPEPAAMSLLVFAAAAAGRRTRRAR